MAVAGALAGVALLLAQEAEASHYRGGTLYAVPAGNNSVQFEGRLMWKISQPAYFWGTPSACTVGATFSSVAASNAIVTGSGPSIPFGIRVLSCNVAQDWFVSKIIDPSTGADGVPFTYPAPLDPDGNPWVAFWEAASRLDTTAPNYHVNNPDVGWRLETLVDLSGVPDNPPRPFVPPVVQCPTAGACTVPIPLADADAGDTHSYRFATSTEAMCQVPIPALPGYCPGGAFYQPGDPACPTCGTAAPATVDPYAGQLDWVTTGATLGPAGSATLYSAQVMVDDGREHVAMDFLIQLIDGAPPEWVIPPSPCGERLEVMQGETIVFELQARSPDPDRVVEIIPLDVPAGATVALGAPANPVDGTFTWTTSVTTPLGEYLSVFFAQDDLGLSARACVVAIRVIPIPTPDFTWVFTTTAPEDLTNDVVAFQDITEYPRTTSPAPRSYAWDFADPLDTAPGLVAAPGHVFQNDGDYLVCMEVTLEFAVPRSMEACHVVHANNRPPVPFPHTMRAAGTQAWFGAVASDPDGQVVALLWEFGDGTTSDEAQPLHAYEPGVYEVCLTATDDDGATGRSCLQLIVRDPQMRVDTDLDGVEDNADNCPEAANRDQADGDRDGQGDACEGAAAGDPRAPPADPRVLPPLEDTDGDGVRNAADNCPLTPSRDQADLDRDGQGDACDLDLDGDGIAQASARADDILDNCPAVANDQHDADGDGRGDACDADGAQGGPAPKAAGQAGARLGGTPQDGTSGPLLLALAAAGGMAALVALVAVWAVRRWK
ncbi:MAG: hypothetical protein QOD77_483 [Thermoplasmata archaeon]|nr:hypothetical protein [Thermoplasmata archaeon]